MNCTTLEWLLRDLSRRSHGRDQIAIRFIRPDDRDRLVRAFCSLDHRSVYQRFFFAKRELGDKELTQITQSDGIRTVVLVATVGTGEQEAIVGLGQYARQGGQGEAAQIAFAIRRDFQGRGIASRMLQRLISIARERGIERLEADVLADNAPMLAVLRHAGLPLRKCQADGIVHATLLLPGPLPRPDAGTPADCD